MTPLVVFTIGHSTRAIAEFIRLLKAHGVQRVIDVRTIPRSRHNPQFNRARLSPALHRARLHLARCIGLAMRERMALMCAEAVPWRCHRSLIADALLVRGIEAREITSGIRTRRHTLTSFARVSGTHVTYPAPRRS